MPSPDDSLDELDLPNGSAHRAYVRRHYVPEADGVWVCPSDLHSIPLEWRENDTLAMTGLLTVMKHIDVRGILFLGDALDGASIGRHPPHGWETKPTVEQEMAAVQHDLGRIKESAKPQVERLWVLGNHDERFNKYLGANSPQFRGVHGFSLSDHFPDWDMAWSAQLGEDVVAVHRWHGGANGRANNVQKSGCHFLSGDTHRLGVTPVVTQTGRTLYGVEAGTMGDTQSPLFEYVRGVTPNWQSGFAVITIKHGVLLPPEIASVDNGACYFRGEVVAGRTRKRVKAAR